MSHEFDWFGHNRTLCNVLEDMRKCLKSQNFSPLKGLIEEAQIMGNRMESALCDQKDLVKLQEEQSKARKAYNKLKIKYNKLKSELEDLEPEELKKSK